MSERSGRGGHRVHKTVGPEYQYTTATYRKTTVLHTWYWYDTYNHVQYCTGTRIDVHVCRIDVTVYIYELLSVTIGITELRLGIRALYR